MKSFLERVAEDLMEKFSGDLSKVAIVFPNKRASLFMNDAIVGQMKNEGAMWSPMYVTISELFRRQTDMDEADDIKLVCELYDVFSKVMDRHAAEMDDDVRWKMSIDSFYGWGQIMLSDFDDMDKNMGDAKQIFSNIEELEKLSENELTEEQVNILKQYISDFKGETHTKLQKRYLALWKYMYEIYDEYNKRLREEGATYEGALYRRVIENGFRTDDYEKYVFVGFNMLQKCEQELFKAVKRSGKAMFYWDYDNSYLETEAGVFIRQYLDKFPGEIGKNDGIFNGMAIKKNVRYCSASTNDIQARYAGNWLKEIRNENSTYKRIEDGRKTAIVLCDEMLAETVLSSIPDEVGDKLNITMGMPLKKTPVASLVMALLQFETDGRYIGANGEVKYKKKYEERLKNHPYYNLIRKEELGIGNEKAEEEQMYGMTTVAGLNGWLADMMKRAAGNLVKEPEITTQSYGNREQAQEGLFRAYKLLNRLGALMEEGVLKDVSLATYENLLKVLIRATSVPYHGEPAEGIQVMGLLETRNLDFDNVLMLSTNEGNMPKGESDVSFIPYIIRKAFGLTTKDNKVAIYAYYFYNLLQRTRDITYCYSLVNDVAQKGEMSRFMQQIVVEDMVNGVESYALNMEGEAKNVGETMDVIKSDEMMVTLKERFGSERLLSPSALNKYIDCGLKFFYNYVCGLNDDSERDPDELAANDYGTIFHDTMAVLYADLTGKNLTREMIEQKQKQVKSTINTQVRKTLFKIDEADTTSETEELNGIQQLSVDSIETYVRRTLRNDEALADRGDFRILELEQEHKKTVKNGDMELTIGGKIDRIDEIRDAAGVKICRVVDYKTGIYTDELKVKGMDGIFDGEKRSKHEDYFFQTFLYSSILADEKNSGMNIYPNLYFVKCSRTPEDQRLKVMNGKTDLLEENGITGIKEEFDTRLEKLIQEIFDKEVPFRASDSGKSCEYCNFKGICNKKY